MKRSTLLVAMAAVISVAASCSQNGSGIGSNGSGGNVAQTSAGGSGGTSVAGGTSGSGGVSGAGGSTTVPATGGNGNGGNAAGATGAGGGVGAGGVTTGTTKLDAAAGGGPGSGGTSTGTAGSTGTGTAGRTGTGAGGRTGTGGVPGAGGAVIVDAGSSDSGVIGATPSTGCGKTTTLTSARASIDVNGETRQYILALPKNYDQNHPYKLIFAWHPWTGTAQQVASGGYYGLQSKSNNEAIFVAADGQDYQDAGQGWGNSGGKDVAFYHAMLDRFRGELCVDENRIFSVGFSFGAMFSFTLGCTADSMLRAIIPMAGNSMTSGGCASGTRKVAVMAFIGTDDSLLSGHRQAVSTYATRDGCSTDTQTMNPSWCDGLSSTNLPCTCVDYQGCADGYPVISCEYKAGHQQAPNPGPIWDFIAQF